MKYKLQKQYRLAKYDYSRSGYYFVTICVKNHACLLGEILNAKMMLPGTGWIAKRFWQEIPRHFKNMKSDAFVIMPNHMHGIIRIRRNLIHQIPNGDRNNCSRNAPWRVPTGIEPLAPNSLASIVNHYKGAVTNWCNRNNHEYFQWQPRFHDRVIRDDDELSRIREYIRQNPLKWDMEKNNPES